MQALIQAVPNRRRGEQRAPAGVQYVGTIFTHRLITFWHERKAYSRPGRYGDTYPLGLEMNTNAPNDIAVMLVSADLSADEVAMFRQMTANQHFIPGPQREALDSFIPGCVSNRYAAQVAAMMQNDDIWLALTWTQNTPADAPYSVNTTGQLHVFRGVNGPAPHVIATMFHQAGLGPMVISPIVPIPVETAAVLGLQAQQEDDVADPAHMVDL